MSIKNPFCGTTSENQKMTWCCNMMQILQHVVESIFSFLLRDLEVETLGKVIINGHWEGGFGFSDGVQSGGRILCKTQLEGLYCVDEILFENLTRRIKE